MANNLNQLLKEAQAMQAKLLEAQNKINDLEVTGTSGGGMVSVVINGQSKMQKVSIDTKLMSPDEKEVVEDLIVAAYNDAKTKLESKISEQMGGIIPPGMKLPF